MDREIVHLLNDFANEKLENYSNFLINLTEFTRVYSRATLAYVEEIFHLPY